jgi:hypothetical protein
MGLSDWFTIFGLFLAVYALFSAEERRIITLKIGKNEPAKVLGLILVTVVLIKYEEIAEKIIWLKSIYVPWGINPANLALLLFLGATVYYAYKLARLADKFPTLELTQYYLDIMKQDFKSFFRLFNKYEKNAIKRRHFKNYEQIIFDPVFLDGVSDQPYYYTDLLDQIEKASFERYFKTLLNKPDSIYYKEIAENDNYSQVQDENYFLYTLIHDKPALFFDIGGMLTLKGWYLNHLEKEKIKRGQSIYNQQADLSLENFELDLPLYLHIWFINMLYTEAILQKIDTSTLSDRFTNMQSIFSHLIDKSVDNIEKATYQQYHDEEYPLKYHYIFAQIFKVISDWIEKFSEPEYFVKNSTLFSFFPFCLQLCITSLIRGYEKEVISEEFLIARLHYGLFHTYYRNNLHDDLREELENVCILKIPKKLLKSTLKYSLNEKFAFSFRDFEVGRFDIPGPHSHEKPVLKQLYKLLSENGLLDD